MKSQILHTVWCHINFWCSCRGNLTLITLWCERVKTSTGSSLVHSRDSQCCMHVNYSNSSLSFFFRGPSHSCLYWQISSIYKLSEFWFLPDGQAIWLTDISSRVRTMKFSQSWPQHDFLIWIILDTTTCIPGQLQVFRVGLLCICLNNPFTLWLKKCIFPTS